MLRNRHVDGMVLMGSSFLEATEAGNEYIRSAASTIPMLLLNGAFTCENVYCVLCDDRRAMSDAVRELAAAGRRRILYLYNNENDSGLRKLEGYRDGLNEAGLPLDEKLVVRISRSNSGVGEVRDALTALHRSGVAFDAVLTCEDLLAVGAVKYAHACGLSVPEELSIIGYNNSDLCQYCEPELTSVDNRLSAICDQIVSTMLGVLEGREMPQMTVFNAELVRRGSTK